MIIMALTLDLFVRKRLTYQDLNNKIQIPIQNYINQKCVIQDEVSVDIAANKIVRRDAQGRVKFAAPEEPEHGARKAEVDAAVNSLGSQINTQINTLKSQIEDGTVVAKEAKSALAIQGHDISISTGTITFGEGTTDFILDSYSTSQNYAYFVWFSPIQIDGSTFRWPDWRFVVRNSIISGKELVIRFNEPEGYSCNYTILRVKRTT